VNLEIAKGRLEGGHLREQLPTAGSRLGPPGVPTVEQRLGDEAGQGEEDEAHPGLETRQAAAEGENEHPGKERRGHQLEPAPHQGERRGDRAQRDAHRHRTNHHPGEHRPQRDEPPPSSREARVPHRRKHLEREAHDEQADPAIDLRLSVGVDVLERDAGEPPRHPHLEEEPDPPALLRR
jgi:hypothetical protein